MPATLKLRGGARPGAGRKPKLKTARDQTRARLVHDYIVPHLDRAKATKPMTQRARREVIETALRNAAADLAAELGVRLSIDADDVRDKVLAMVFDGTGASRGVYRAGSAQRPSPLSLQDKVRLADQLTQNKNYLAHVAHVSDHPGDLFLRLFRYALGIFLSFVAAQAMFVLRSKFDNDVSPVLGLVVIIVLLSVIAFWESVALSAKNIATTKGKIEKAIADAEAKLGLRP